MRERICTNAFYGYCLFLRLCYSMGSCQKRKAEETGGEDRAPTDQGTERKVKNQKGVVS